MRAGGAVHVADGLGNVGIQLHTVREGAALSMPRCDVSLTNDREHFLQRKKARPGGRILGKVDILGVDKERDVVVRARNVV